MSEKASWISNRSAKILAVIIETAKKDKNKNDNPGVNTTECDDQKRNFLGWYG